MELKSFILSKESQPQFKQFTQAIDNYRQFLTDLKHSFLLSQNTQETKLFFTLELYKTIKIHKSDFDLVIDLLYLFYHENQNILKGISCIIALFGVDNLELTMDYVYKDNHICIYFLSCILKSIEIEEKHYDSINQCLEFLFAKIQDTPGFLYSSISQKTTVSLLVLFQSIDYSRIERLVLSHLLSTQSNTLYIFISNLLLELCKISDYSAVLQRLKNELKTTRFDLIIRPQFNPLKYKQLGTKILSTEIKYFNSMYTQIQHCDQELDLNDLKLLVQGCLILNQKFSTTEYNRVINAIINYLTRNNIKDTEIYNMLPTRWKIQYMETRELDDLMECGGIELYLGCEYVIRMAKKRVIVQLKDKSKIIDFINNKPLHN
ncbi:hypothetical protein HDV01_006197 [Terramyces sp. JEL0728]|nr:hypothetical protein HDV01_006197 [Terramyces sp. JEL0728]